MHPLIEEVNKQIAEEVHERVINLLAGLANAERDYKRQLKAMDERLAYTNGLREKLLAAYDSEDLDLVDKLGVEISSFYRC